ncbi:helix-turn-helix domain-containing protein [Propionibacteriaceae bacterium Y1700]|uniref:helix-turn-helix domain-containing protein n=1 Tax=Microlunatus sp. Y1700 TaxID=3418487 RepID=UPI003DA7631F
MASPPLDPEDIRIGATIAAFRMMRGYTQDALSSHREVLISRAYLANIEAGRKRPSGRVISRIAIALGVPQIAIIRPDLVTTEEDAA